MASTSSIEGVNERLSAAHLVSARSSSIDASGIRKIFELGAKLRDPINLSIGQPDFPVPLEIKKAAIHAIESDHNGYSLTMGAPAVQEVVWNHLSKDVGWTRAMGQGAMLTSGTSGALVLAALALLEAGDEVVFPDPYFILYPQLGRLTGAVGVACDTYPDFRMTAVRLEKVMTPRTKMVILVSPSNPCGVVLSSKEIAEVVELCRARKVLLISDEIYDEFTFSDAREDGRCPSAARMSRDVLLVRGLGKTYGCTGWRMGYCAGPEWLIQEMAKLQQYSYVCAPTPFQHATAAALATDMSGIVDGYERRRDLVLEAFKGVTEVARPGGAFYAFVKVPEQLNETAKDFVSRAVDRNVLVIPGSVFSARDTHFRLSFAAPEQKLRAGLSILREMMQPG
ncbi:MAG: pyridoxal phosphate-dependent aminotransferase [Planctomycetota bacterium]|nr:pyridoxal phosphate-dependent aminotransferase [Planctomycetota bacterium]